MIARGQHHLHHHGGLPRSRRRLSVLKRLAEQQASALTVITAMGDTAEQRNNMERTACKAHGGNITTTHAAGRARTWRIKAGANLMQAARGSDPAKLRRSGRTSHSTLKQRAESAIKGVCVPSRPFQLQPALPWLHSMRASTSHERNQVSTHGRCTMKSLKRSRSKGTQRTQGNVGMHGRLIT